MRCCRWVGGAVWVGPEEVGPLLKGRTRAGVAVGSTGGSHRLAELGRVCARHGVPLLVDAAQSLGATHAGRSVASYGALSALSFHATKNLSCGEGGALIVNDASMLQRAEMVREGTDVTIFCYSRMRYVVMQAVAQLAKEVYNLEVGGFARAARRWRCWIGWAVLVGACFGCAGR